MPNSYINRRIFGQYAPMQFISATGGTVITDGNYKIHVFTSNDNFQITSAPHGATFDYLVVAGGGGGGSGYGGIGGGGGGAGGVLTGTDSAIVSTLPIVIGGGGNGAPANTANTNGSNGSNTTFNSHTAIGGGGGNTFNAASAGNGGSGGGGAWNDAPGTGTVGQGNNGGTGINTPSYNGGGGGGASAVGGNGVSGGGGNGGDGLLSAIAGILSYYGGGGGGASNDSVSLGFGGLGGGGNGGKAGSAGLNGTPNTGGGGGGGHLNTGAGGNGGSGIVIVRYQYMASCYPNLKSATLLTNLVDSNAIGYSTFQSHNQKVVSNANGVFFTYGKTSNAPYTNQTWILAKTTNGGATVTNLYTGTSSQSAPCMETDSSNNLYLIAPFDATDAKLYIFNSADYTTPATTVTLAGVAQEKYSMALDEVNNRIYFTSNSNKFIVLNMSGTVIIPTYTFTANGTYAVAEYPHLHLDNNGNLYCAWTTHYNVAGRYWSISWVVSRDHGATWQKADGTPLTLPIIVDTSGPANQITRSIESKKDTWLANFLYANERLHGMYYMQDDNGDTKQEYVRINPTTGDVEIRTIQALVCNPTIAGLDGFFIRPSFGTFASPSTLYFITESENRYLVSAVSTDNGVTWKKNNILDINPPAGWRVYSVGGFRQLIGGNKAYGAFTLQDLNTPPYYQNGSGKVYFIELDV